VTTKCACYGGHVALECPTHGVGGSPLVKQYLKGEAMSEESTKRSVLATAEATITAASTVATRLRTDLGDIHAFSSGAKSSGHKPRYDLIPTWALERIARWHGEFPDTGKTWPTGGAVSYAAECGSNGERDYMRQIALDALKSRAADALDSQPTVANGWISVKDRLPPTSVMVMVWQPRTTMNYPDDILINFDCIDPEDDDANTWQGHNNWRDEVACIAKPPGSIVPPHDAPYTHWQPIPADPASSQPTDGEVRNG